MNFDPDHEPPSGEPPLDPGPEAPRGLWLSWSPLRLLLFGGLLLLSNILIQAQLFLWTDDLFVPALGGGLIGVILPCLLVSRGVGGRPVSDWQLRRPSLDVLVWSGVLALGGLYPTSFLAGISEQLVPVDPEWLAFFTERLPETPAETVVAVVAVVVVAPLAEELLFRGLLQRLARGMWGAWLAALIASLCFGLVHGEPWYLFGLIGLGLILAFVWETTRSVIACWITHAVHNAVVLALLLTTAAADPTQSPLATRDAVPLMVSLLVLAFAGYRLRRCARR